MAFDMTVAPMLMKNITTTQRRPPIRFLLVESANNELYQEVTMNLSLHESWDAYLIKAGLTARARHMENCTRPFVEARAKGGAYRLMRSMFNLKSTPSASATIYCDQRDVRMCKISCPRNTQAQNNANPKHRLAPRRRNSFFTVTTCTCDVIQHRERSEGQRPNSHEKRIHFRMIVLAQQRGHHEQLQRGGQCARNRKRVPYLRFLAQSNIRGYV